MLLSIFYLKKNIKHKQFKYENFINGRVSEYNTNMIIKNDFC